MLDTISLENIRAGMAKCIKDAQSLLTKLDEKISAVQADASRTQDYMRNKIKEHRDNALPEIADSVRTLDERLERVVGSKPFWKSRLMVISLRKFDADPVKDAAIRVAHIAEMTAMPFALLHMQADEIKARIQTLESFTKPQKDALFARLWMLCLVSRGRAGEPEWSEISLDDIQIDEQAEALGLIETCRAMAWLGHDIYAQACGTQAPALDRMTAGHDLPALDSVRKMFAKAA